MKIALLRNLAVGIVIAGMLASCVSTSVGARHPNLADAQALIENALVKISAAQAANEYDLGGHAAKAKALLTQADAEIKLAAEAANRK